MTKYWKWALRIGIIGVSIFGLVTSFQNCAQSGANSESSVGDENIFVDPRFSKLGFPYSLAMNHFAYLSCTNDNHFTFKVGGYNDAESVQPLSTGWGGTRILSEGGLVIRTDFLTEFDKATPNMNLDQKRTQLKQALSTIVPGRNIQPFFSLRDPRSATGGDSASGLEIPGTDEVVHPLSLVMYSANVNSSYAFSLGRLNDPVFTNYLGYDPIHAQGYFPDAVADKRELAMEIAVKHSDDPINEKFFDNVRRGGLLAGFVRTDKSKTDGNFPLLYTAGPMDEDKSNRFRAAYGQYFKFDLTTRFDGSSSTAGIAPRFITNLREMSLETGIERPVSGANWICEDYMVVWKDDRNVPAYRKKDQPSTCAGGLRSGCVSKPACPIENSGSLDIQKVATMAALRRFLPVEEWDINMTDRCVVPKRARCTNDSNVTYSEVFFPEAAVQADKFVTGMAVGCGGNLRSCPHYLSFCYRTGPTPK